MTRPQELSARDAVRHCQSLECGVAEFGWSNGLFRLFRYFVAWQECRRKQACRLETSICSAAASGVLISEPTPTATNARPTREMRRDEHNDEHEGGGDGGAQVEIVSSEFRPA